MRRTVWSLLLKRARGIASVFLLTLLLFPAGLFVPGPAHAFEGEDGSTGLHDTAGVFSDQERREIEDAIRDVEAAGAPTVVYLRLLHTVSDRAVEHGQRLMEAWEIESEPGARDGVVIFFNLEPDDPDRGEFGIVAGETHFEDGALPQSELDRIQDQMTDLLVDDRMAEAIVLGLELTAQRLDAGPPEPTALERVLDVVASGPVSILNLVSFGLAAIIGTIGWRTWRDRPRAPHIHQVRSTQPPADEEPGVAGALVAANVDPNQIEATILAMATRGALVFEPDPDRDEQLQVRLLDRTRTRTAYEAMLFDVLAGEATAGVLDKHALVRAQAHWGDVQDLIRQELEARGWFDPDASSNRQPLLFGGLAGIGFGVLAFLPIFVIEEPWVIAGSALLGAFGMLMLILTSAYPHTTFEGERAAAPWRGYRAGLQEEAKRRDDGIDLDIAFTYIVAMGLTARFDQQFKRAGKAGYIPKWLGELGTSGSGGRRDWYPYWTSFHHSVHPQAGGSGSSAGGAATGSGGSGGRF